MTDWYLDYWATFHNYLRSYGGAMQPYGQVRNYSTYRAGRSELHFATAFNARENWICVALTPDGHDAKRVFDRLKEQRVVIEAELGETLTWLRKESNCRSQVRLERRGVVPGDRSAWPEQHEWLRSHLEDFNACFGPRLEEFR